jgi:uncharacterized protein with PQ loop repeat
MGGFDLDTIALGAAAIATVLAAIGALPQVRLVARTGDVSGVSFSMVTLNAASEAGWFAHFAGRGEWAAVPASFVIVAAYGALGLTLARAGSRPRQPVAVGAGWVVVLIGSRFSMGPAALGTLLAATKVVQVTPQVWTAWRTRRPTGVSSTMWMMAVVESTLWAGYGVVQGDAALVFLGAVGATAGIAVLARLNGLRERGERCAPGGRTSLIAHRQPGEAKAALTTSA